PSKYKGVHRPKHVPFQCISGNKDVLYDTFGKVCGRIMSVYDCHSDGISSKTTFAKWKEPRYTVHSQATVGSLLQQGEFLGATIIFPKNKRIIGEVQQ